MPGAPLGRSLGSGSIKELWKEKGENRWLQQHIIQNPLGSPSSEYFQKPLASDRRSRVRPSECPSHWQGGGGATWELGEDVGSWPSSLLTGRWWFLWVTRGWEAIQSPHPLVPIPAPRHQGLWEWGQGVPGNLQIWPVFPWTAAPTPLGQWQREVIGDKFYQRLSLLCVSGGNYKLTFGKGTSLIVLPCEYCSNDQGKFVDRLSYGRTAQ
jgi:hypothetical protein